MPKLWYFSFVATTFVISTQYSSVTYGYTSFRDKTFLAARELKRQNLIDFGFENVVFNRIPLLVYIEIFNFSTSEQPNKWETVNCAIWHNLLFPIC